MEADTGLVFSSQRTEVQSLREVTNTPEVFFDILPADWSDNIEPRWEEYCATSRIFVLQTSEREVLGGGIVFNSIPPDTVDEAEARRLFDQGISYIGFLWISETQRGRNLGSTWLKELRAKLPGKRFWLTIDDYCLAGFYKRNGFRLVKEVTDGTTVEWLMTDAPA